MSSRLADILVKTGIISEDDRTAALAELQSNAGASLAAQLVSMDLVSETELVRALSSYFQIPHTDPSELEVPPELLELIPKEFCRRHTLLPLSRHGQTLVIAVADPSNFSAIDDLKFLTNLNIELRITSESAIKAALEKLFDQSNELDHFLGDFSEEVEVSLDDEEEELDISALQEATEDAPVVRLVNAILSDAIRRNASDIHIEPYEKSFRVRFRIDGVLYEVMKPPLKLKNAIVSRLKIMAHLDIAERRLPQDGRIKLTLARKREMDFRVNVLPTLFGEKIVLRLLDKTNLQLDMTKLGFEATQLIALKDALSKPHGMILVTGPTGSGKTTTLYSALAELNKTTTNISTAEDPVEFNIAGINQAQINEDIGLTFAAALRAFLRQDPDVIMVGEIRDFETAEIAIKASLTGHLVLSTLHTNDAPATVNRLLNMGVEPFLVASSINVIIAQRLARRICLGCKEHLPINPEVLVSIGISAVEATQLETFHGTGCTKCSGTGYKGRIALYEAMVMDEELRTLVLNGASSAELKRHAIQRGMMTLRASALMRVREGLTTVEETLRVTAAD